MWQSCGHSSFYIAPLKFVCLSYRKKRSIDVACKGFHIDLYLCSASLFNVAFNSRRSHSHLCHSHLSSAPIIHSSIIHICHSSLRHSHLSFTPMNHVFITHTSHSHLSHSQLSFISPSLTPANSIPAISTSAIHTCHSRLHHSHLSLPQIHASSDLHPHVNVSFHYISPVNQSCTVPK